MPKTLTWVVYIIILIIIVGAIGMYFFRTSSNKNSAQSSITPSAFVPTDTPFAIETPVPSPSPSVSPTPTPATIEIRNGTHIAGLAQKIKDKLTIENFTVSTIGNAVNKSVTKTTVYDLNVTDADVAQQLAKELSANASSTLPKGELKSSADILIILGANAASIK